ncbi:unnamed protein product, partial [Notodromas monacha]
MENDWIFTCKIEPDEEKNVVAATDECEDIKDFLLVEDSGDLVRVRMSAYIGCRKSLDLVKFIHSHQRPEEVFLLLKSVDIFLANSNDDWECARCTEVLMLTKKIVEQRAYDVENCPNVDHIRVKCQDEMGPFPKYRQIAVEQPQIKAGGQVLLAVKMVDLQKEDSLLESRACANILLCLQKMDSITKRKKASPMDPLDRRYTLHQEEWVQLIIFIKKMSSALFLDEQECVQQSKVDMDPNSVEYQMMVVSSDEDAALHSEQAFSSSSLHEFGDGTQAPGVITSSRPRIRRHPLDERGNTLRVSFLNLPLEDNRRIAFENCRRRQKPRWGQRERSSSCSWTALLSPGSPSSPTLSDSDNETVTLTCPSCKVSVDVSGRARFRQICPYCGNFYNAAAQTDPSLRTRRGAGHQIGFPAIDNQRFSSVVVQRFGRVNGSPGLTHITEVYITDGRRHSDASQSSDSLPPLVAPPAGVKSGGEIRPDERPTRTQPYKTAGHGCMCVPCLCRVYRTPACLASTLYGDFIIRSSNRDARSIDSLVYEWSPMYRAGSVDGDASGARRHAVYYARRLADDLRAASPPPPPAHTRYPPPGGGPAGAGSRYATADGQPDPRQARVPRSRTLTCPVSDELQLRPRRCSFPEVFLTIPENSLPASRTGSAASQ